jgi:serine/threonine-protein kinase
MKAALNEDKWQRLEALFHQASSLPQSDRAHFLDQACAGDPELRCELDELLAADAATSGFEAPAARSANALFAAVTEDPLARPGARIGAFQLQQLIGAGGMGTVWLAARADEQFEQRVAIKLIKRGMDTDEVLRRFRRERQVLARLEHPHIARLLDGGATADGRPYLVMEYIEGETITGYCSRNRMSLADRLALFLKVCSAVQYAHQNLVVHRDLKPTNILVSADGTPKLLDFGIAKILRPDDGDMAVTTASELRLLTPRYASPEQVKNERVTTATDAYSLGVILYELLTGEEPYQLTTRSRADYERAICEQEPLRPSAILTRSQRVDGLEGPTASTAAPDRRTRRKQLSGDLDTIVLKALRKEPRERYASVQQLAVDLQRFLAGMPVLARPHTLPYRTAKFVMRNKAAVAAGTGIALIVVLAAVVSFTFAIREARQRSLAERRLKQAETQAAIAQAINTFLNEDLLGSVDPDRTSDRNVTVRSVLDNASQGIGARFKGQPAVEAAILSTLGTTYESLGEYDEAERHLTRAHKLFLESTGEASADSILALARLGNLKRLRANLTEADPLINKSLELAERNLGTRHPAALYARHYLGELYIDQGRLPEAIATLEEAVKLRGDSLGASAFETLTSMQSLGVAQSQAGHYEKAEQLHTQILEHRTRVFGADSAAAISTLNNIGYARMDQDKYAEAEELFRTAIDRARRVLGDEHPNTLIMIDNLGLICTRLGRYEEAEELHSEAYEGRLRTLGPDHWDTITSHSNLGFLYVNNGQFEKAAVLYAELVPRITEVSGKDHPFTLTAKNNLAYSLMGLDRLEEAERSFLDVVERRSRVLGRDHPDAIGSLSNLAKVTMDQGRFAEAQTLLSDAMARASRSLPQDHAIVGVLHHRWGVCLTGLGQFEEAETSLARALEILTAALGQDHPKVAAVKAATKELDAAKGKSLASSGAAGSAHNP